MLRWVNDADEAIDLLGGTQAVAAMFKDVSRSQVANWRKRGFPPASFTVLRERLLKRKLAFDRHSLFGMLEPNDGGHDG